MKRHLPTGREGYFKWGKSFAKSGTGGGLGPDPGGPGGLGAPLWEEKKILNRNNIRSDGTSCFHVMTRNCPILLLPIP